MHATQNVKSQDNICDVCNRGMALWKAWWELSGGLYKLINLMSDYEKSEGEMTMVSNPAFI